ncbi:MFS transporter [Variovorax sp. PBL-E5]|uniref:MFS transporter n=1 Tax=Variovorax sp. PBL-E5 TaxID=434014 RepID=UPI001318D825|nr:MFS transporter [Variovorax sp. PBL-E5]VTU24990.1 Spectinomycin tetracycline efflux pump [Variovorax sp. PBL-E5]
MTSQVIAGVHSRADIGGMTSDAALAHPVDAHDAGWPTLILVLSGTFMVVLDFFIVNVALPSIQRELHASDSALQLVIAGYGLANAAGLITGGRLGDLFGRRRMFMTGLLLFTLASAACGLAPGAGVLVAGRVAQGLAGALLQPQVLAMLGLVFTGPARARAFGAYGLTLGLGAVLGQLIGGVLIHADLAQMGWRSCFLINVPIGLAGLALGMRWIPALKSEGHSRLDMPGAVIVAVLLSAVLWPLVEGRQEGWPLWSVASLLAAVALAVGLALHQRRREAHGAQPLIAPGLLRLPGYAQGLLVTLVFYAGNASFYFVLAIYLQQVMGLSALASGAVFTALALGFFATSMASARLDRWLGRRAITCGAVVLAAGHAALVGLVLRHGGEGIVPWMLPILWVEGAGIGMIMAPLVSAVLAAVPAAHAGVAAGMLATVQQVGNSLGVALIGIVFYADWQRPQAAFVAAIGYLLLSALGVAMLFARRRPRAAAAPR